MSKNIFLLVALMLGAVYSVEARSVYKCVEQGGTISYQDRPCHNEAESMLASRGIVDEQSYADSIKLQSGALGDKQVGMYVFKWWRAFSKEIDERFLHFKFTDDEGDTPITLLVDFIVPASEDALSDKEIRSFFQSKAEKFLKTSVETQLLAQKMKADNGFGYYQTFTDKNLVGKSSYPPGEYLYTTSGLMTHGDVIVNFTLLSNDYTAQNHQFAMIFLGKALMIEDRQDAAVDVSDMSYLEQATVALLKQKIVDSVELFRLATIEEPENFQTWYGYCISLREVNRLQSAFVACDKAKLLGSDETNIDYEIWNLLIKGKMFELAFEIGKKLFNQVQSDEHIQAMINLGYFAMHEEEFEMAQRAFDFLVQKGVDSAKLTHDLAMLAHARGDNAQAMAIVKELKGMGKDMFVTALQHGGSLFSVHENEEPYVVMPERFKKLGTGEVADMAVDAWVTQRFHVKGVGLLEVETPEHWIAKGEIDIQSGNHVLSLKVFDPLAMTKMMVIDLGKVASDWTLNDAEEQMKTTLNVFFPDGVPALKALSNGEKGYELEELIEEDSATIRVKHKVSLDGVVEYSINMTELNGSVEDRAIHDRIFNHVKLVATDQKPLDLLDDTEQQAGIQTIESAKKSVSVKEYDPSIELPKPPSGYSWHKMDDIMAIFLKPDGWHTNTKNAEDGITHVISKEPASTNKDFETGLTVIGSKGVLNTADTSINKFALGVAQGIEKSGDNTLIGIQNKTNEAFSSFIIQFENHPEGKKPIRIHQIISGNKKTGSVYMVLFEAPKDEWDEAWKVGEVILKSYVMDDEF